MAGWVSALIGLTLLASSHYLRVAELYAAYAAVFWSGAILLATGLCTVVASYLVREPSLGSWRVGGVVLLMSGILLLDWVGLSIYLNQSNCEGGEGPGPPQGCGHVSHLVLYLYGGLYQIVCGSLAFALGLAYLVMGRARRPAMHRQSRQLKSCRTRRGILHK